MAASVIAVATGADTGCAGFAAVVKVVVADAAPAPAAFEAFTANMYFVPAESPVMVFEVEAMFAIEVSVLDTETGVHVVAGAVTVHCNTSYVVATVEVAPFTVTTFAALRLSDAELSAAVPAVLQVSLVIVTELKLPVPETHEHSAASAAVIVLSSSVSQASKRAALDLAQPRLLTAELRAD
jgi:hypothetical protein